MKCYFSLCDSRSEGFNTTARTARAARWSFRRCSLCSPCWPGSPSPSTPPTMQVFCIYSAPLLRCRYFAFPQYFSYNTGITHSLCIPPTMQIFHICSESPAQCRYFKFAQYLSYAAYIYIKSRYSPYCAGILHLFSISRTLQVLHTCFISHFSHCTLAYSIARTMQIRYTYRV